MTFKLGSLFPIWYSLTQAPYCPGDKLLAVSFPDSICGVAFLIVLTRQGRSSLVSPEAAVCPVSRHTPLKPFSFDFFFLPAKLPNLCFGLKLQVLGLKVCTVNIQVKHQPYRPPGISP